MSRRRTLLRACAALTGVPLLSACGSSMGLVTYPGTGSGERMAEPPTDTSHRTEARRPSQTELDGELSTLVDNAKGSWAQVAALALRDGQTVYSGYFGRRFIHATDRALDLPVTDRTLFRVASISKLVVAVAVMRLVEAGRLDLDADVSEALGWSLRHPAFAREPITLRLLMTHRAGLSDAAGYSWGPEVALRDVLRPEGPRYGEGTCWLRGHAPGRWFSYCNLNWGVIGTVMESVTGERFDHLMRRLILQPLGLRGGFNPAEFPAEDLHDLATLYRKRRTLGTREIWEPNGPWVAQADDHRGGAGATAPQTKGYAPGTNGTLFSPQGGLRISVAGLGTVMQMLLNGGRHGAQALLSPAALGQLAREQWRHDPLQPNGHTLDDAMLSWALGPQRFTDASGPGRGDRLIEGGGLTGWGHMGDAYGLLGSFVLDPSTRCGMVTIIGGPRHDPGAEKGRWSAMARAEEQVMSAVWRATRC